MFFHQFRRALQEDSRRNGNPVIFRLYMIIIGIYAGIQVFISFLMRIPFCHQLTNQCDRWPLIRFVKWMRQVSCYLNFFLSSLCIAFAASLRFCFVLNFPGLFITMFIFEGTSLCWAWHVRENHWFHQVFLPLSLSTQQFSLTSNVHWSLHNCT